MVDRRGLLAGAAAFAVSGCGTSASEDEPGGSPPERSATSRQGDIELLQAALAMELAGTGKHDLAQADRLRELLLERKAEPTGEPEDAPVPPGRALAFYLDMLPKLYDEGLRSSIATILVVDSSQLAAERLEGGEDALADAFVYGEQPA